MQYVIGPLPFRNTIEAAATRCGICRHYLAENVIRAWENWDLGTTMDQRNICPKCAKLPHDTLKAILFPSKKCTADCHHHNPEMTNGCDGVDWRGLPGPSVCREYRTEAGY